MKIKASRVKLAPYRTFRINREKTIRLYHEDCIKGMDTLFKRGSVDVVVTSPPYNIGVKYGSHRDELPREEYLEWMGEVGKSVLRLLNEKGSFFLNVGGTPKDQWIAWDVAQAMRKHFVLQNVIHWVKSIAISRADVGDYPNIIGDVAVGHFKPIVSRRFLNDCHEYIFHFTKRGDVDIQKLAVGVPYQDKTNIGRWKTARTDRRDRGNTWFIPYKTITKRAERPHPATFPVKLPEMCITLHGLRKNLLVVDPFLGIGSTAVASMRLGVSFVGFDIDEEYLKETADRLSALRIQLRGTA